MTFLGTFPSNVRAYLKKGAMVGPHAGKHWLNYLTFSLNFNNLHALISPSVQYLTCATSKDAQFYRFILLMKRLVIESYCK